MSCWTVVGSNQNYKKNMLFKYVFTYHTHTPYLVKNSLIHSYLYHKEIIFNEHKIILKSVIQKRQIK